MRNMHGVSEGGRVQRGCRGTVLVCHRKDAPLLASPSTASAFLSCLLDCCWPLLHFELGVIQRPACGWELNLERRHPVSPHCSVYRSSPNHHHRTKRPLPLPYLITSSKTQSGGSDRRIVAAAPHVQSSCRRWVLVLASSRHSITSLLNDFPHRGQRTNPHLSLVGIYAARRGIRKGGLSALNRRPGVDSCPPGLPTRI